MYEIERREDVSIVDVDDDLDCASQARLRTSIESAERFGARIVIVSLVSCEYCDSSGLSELIIAQRRLGLRFHVIVPPGARCRRVFDLTGLTAILQISPSLEGALALCASIE